VAFTVGSVTLALASGLSSAVVAARVAVVAVVAISVDVLGACVFGCAGTGMAALGNGPEK
jgi:hypothetical protein